MRYLEVHLFKTFINSFFSQTTGTEAREQNFWGTWSEPSSKSPQTEGKASLIRHDLTPSPSMSFTILILCELRLLKDKLHPAAVMSSFQSLQETDIILGNVLKC